jgi:hypothetical protein
VIRKLLPALLVIASARCATIDHGPLQRIHVESNPPAHVKTTECGAGSTRAAKSPGVVWVNRRATRCALMFAAPGFDPETVSLHREMSDDTFENVRVADDFCDGDFFDCIFLGGFFAGAGFGIDAATGAMFRQEPADVYVELEPSP